MATVTSLKHRDIMDLAYMMDGSDRTWCALGKQLLPEVPKNEIEFLVHGYTEEYSFSRRFIDSLSSRLNVATIMDFIKMAKKFRRNDIAIYLERLNFPMDSPIWELPWEQTKVLLYFLEKEARYDWTMFADELGYSSYEIKVIEKERKSYGPRHESPSVLLFRIMTIVKPDLELKKFIPVCERLGRNDVAAHLRRLLERNKHA